MKRAAGFTLIELLITISIMVILLALTVVSLRNNQANSRDEERTSDVLAIAQQLENYYKNGSDKNAQYVAGQYPPTAYLNSEANVQLALEDIDANVLRAPNVALGSSMSLSMATSASAPSPTTSDYIYQPLGRDGTLCDLASEYCSKFTIFYKLETNATTQTVMSKHQ